VASAAAASHCDYVGNAFMASTCRPTEQELLQLELAGFSHDLGVRLEADRVDATWLMFSQDVQFAGGMQCHVQVMDPGHICGRSTCTL
jgi:hypothetical protein